MVKENLRARALLIGTGTYQSVKIPDVPAVAGTVRDLSEALAASLNFANSQIDVLLDPVDQGEVGEALHGVADSAADMLLVYYVGHGFRHHRGELYLATSSADPTPGRMAFRSTRYADIREVVQESPAKSKVVILDCCFSGQAIDTLAASEHIDMAGIQGAYVLVAAPRDEFALAKQGESHTAFTGELIKLLRNGDASCGEFLSLQFIYSVLAKRLPQRGCARPQRQSSDLLDVFPFAFNVAYRPEDTRFAGIGVDPSEETFAEIDRLKRTPSQQAEIEIASIAKAMLQSGLDVTMENVGGGIRIVTPGGAAIDLPMSPKSLVEQPWWLEIRDGGELVVVKQTLDRGRKCEIEYISGSTGEILLSLKGEGETFLGPKLTLVRRPPSRHSIKVEFDAEATRFPKFGDRVELSFAEEKAMLRELRVSEEAIGNRQWSRLSDI